MQLHTASCCCRAFSGAACVLPAHRVSEEGILLSALHCNPVSGLAQAKEDRAPTICGFLQGYLTPLFLQAEDLPVAPVVIPGSLSNSAAQTPRAVRIQLGSEASGNLHASRRSQDASDPSFSNSRRTPMSARIKRSSSVLFGA